VHIKLLRPKHIEIHGKMTRCFSGDWIEVGRQTANKWVANGDAVIGARKDPFLTLPSLEDFSMTIFCLPFPFVGKHLREQQNAIQSWTMLGCNLELMFLMTEKDRAVGACPFDGKTILIDADQYGTPLISSVFKTAQENAAPGEILCYVNSDIIMLGLDGAVGRAARAFPDLPFLVIGRRWDMDIVYSLSFEKGWQKELGRQVLTGGKRRGVDAIDFFAFRNGTFGDVPPFAVGRSAWDNWLVADALSRNVNVIDVSMVVHPVHQEIPARVKHQKPTKARDEQHARNRALYDARRNGFRGITREARFVITQDGNVIRRSDLDFVPESILRK